MSTRARGATGGVQAPRYVLNDIWDIRRPADEADVWPDGMSCVRELREIFTLQLVSLD